MYLKLRLIRTQLPLAKLLFRSLILLVALPLLSSCGYILEEFKSKGSQSPILPSLATFEKPTDHIYINSTTYQSRWSQSLGAERYQVYVYEAADCSGPSGPPTYWLTNVFNVSGLVNGGTYSFKVAGVNSTGTGEWSCSSNVTVDTQLPTVNYISPAAATTSGVLNYTFSWNGADVGVSGLVANNPYRVELFNQGSCTGSAIATSSQNGTSYSAASLIDGATYSIRVVASDKAGNASVGLCSSNLTVSTGSAVLALADATTTLSTHIRQASVSVVVTNDALASKWCLSETQTTAPASGAAACVGGQGTSSGWHTTRPLTLNTSAGDGLKTIYIWIVDSTGSLLGGVVNQGIILDTTVPVAPMVQLSDSLSSSTSTTNQSLVDLSITLDTEATAWCVIEQASGVAAPIAPAWNSGCFVTTKPTTTTLAATGTRRAYVYTRDVAMNVAATAGLSNIITYDLTAPTVTSVTSLTTNGNYTTGQSVSIQVVFSEAVNVTGTPQLLLETGSNDALINYVSGSGTDTLTFTYTIQNNQTSSDLNYQATTSLSLNSGTIRDLAGNTATLTLPGLAAAGSLATQKAIVIQDNQSPIAPSGWTMSSPANAALSNDNTPTITVPAISDEGGSSARVFSEGTCTTQVGTAVTVSPSTTTNVTTITYLTNGTQDGAKSYWGQITDASGNLGACASLSLGYTLDTIAPTVLNVTSSIANGRYGTGIEIPIQITFSESVNHNGHYGLNFETGSVDGQTNYSGNPTGNGTSTLTFFYYVQDSHISADLDYVGTASLFRNWGSLTDLAGNEAIRTLPIPGTAGSLGANKNIEIRAYALATSTVIGGTGGPHPYLGSDVHYSGQNTQPLRSPNTNHIYVTTRTERALTVFEQNPADGSLTVAQTFVNGVGGVSFSGNNHKPPVLSPDGQFLYVISPYSSSVVFSRNTTTGLLTHSTTVSPATTMMGFSPDGLFAYLRIDNGLSVRTRNPVTGLHSTIVQTVTDNVGGVNGLSGDKIFLMPPDGNHIYFFNEGGITVFSRNATTGLLTLVDRYVNGVGGFDIPDSNTRAPFSDTSGQRVYCISADNRLAVYDRNTTNGQLTQVQYLTLPSNPVVPEYSFILYFTPNELQAYVVSQYTGSDNRVYPRVLIYDRNASTGQLTFNTSQDLSSYVRRGTLGDLVFSAAGDYAYLSGHGALSIWSRNTTTGQLTYVSDIVDGEGGVPTLSGITDLELSSTSDFLYASSYRSGNSIFSFSFDQVTGALGYLNRVQYRDAGVGGVGFKAKITPDGKFVYSSNEAQLQLFTRNTTTGALTYSAELPNVSNRFNAIKKSLISSDSAYFYPTNSGGRLPWFSIDSVLGTLTYINELLNNVGGVTRVSSMTAQVFSPGEEQIYSLSERRFLTTFNRNTSTGALTFVSQFEHGVGGVTGLDNSWALAITPDGKFLYTADWTTGGYGIYSRSLATGALTYVTHFLPTFGTRALYGLAISPDGRYLAAASSDANTNGLVLVYERDSATGLLRHVETRTLFPGSGNGQASIVFSANGKFLLANSSEGNSIHVFEVLP